MALMRPFAAGRRLWRSPRPAGTNVEVGARQPGPSIPKRRIKSMGNVKFFSEKICDGWRFWHAACYQLMVQDFGRPIFSPGNNPPGGLLVEEMANAPCRRRR